MCRHLAWLGPPRSIASLVLEPPWSLLRQSYEPRRQDHGLMNADGFGIAWYDSAVRNEPARYRRSVPIWTDASLPSFAPMVISAAFTAFLRSTTIGMPIQETDTAPFVSGRWCFGMNGATTLDSIRPLVPVGRTLENACDATLIAAIVLERLAVGEDPELVLTEVVRVLASRDPAARLNLLVSDGEVVAATTWGASLSYLHDAGLAAGGTLVASEPLDDDPAWIDVPDRSLLVADKSGVRVGALA
jgi:glutamine amidotransferase